MTSDEKTLNKKIMIDDNFESNERDDEYIHQKDDNLSDSSETSLSTSEELNGDPS
jgi:hypothetical protein